MEIKVTRHGDVPVFRLKGRLSVVGADDLEKQIVQSIDAGAKRLLFVLDDLEYISSAGLRVLLIVAKKVQQAQGKVALCGLTPNVREIFAISGFDAIFTIQPDAAAAVAAVR